MMSPMSARSSWLGRAITGALSLSVGSFALGACLLSLISSPPQKEERAQAPERVIERVVKPKKQQVKRKPQRRVTRRKSSSPKPNLSTDLSQMGTGVPLFAMQGAELSMSSLLGDDDQAGQELIMSAETVDSLPKPLVNCQPRLTRDLIQSQKNGWVKVKLLISASGELGDLQILESQPRGVYDQVVTDAMRGCRWRPATYRGNPSALQTYKTFRFQKG